MDLTPVTQEEVQSGVIFVDAQRRQLIGVRTTTVMMQNLDKTIRAVGIIAYDETRLTDVTLKFRGWIGELFADYTGKHVQQGEPLFTIYSPELLSAQQEYLDSLAATDLPGRTTRVAEASRDRLLLWDLSQKQLEELAQHSKPLQYLPMLSPATGTIIHKMVVKGSAVEPGKLIYRIADLSNVWIEAELYEDEIPLVQVGQSVNVSVAYLPGRQFEGTVSYIYPYLNGKTRRGRVRLEVSNEDGLLRPDMFADVFITVPLGSRLVVPEEAILYGGENNVVFLDLGEGRIRPQRVTLGLRAAHHGLGTDLVEVIAGLAPGDVVVTSGNFLIASESKLKAGIEKW
jgi:Cu(I)/Ag(I) efflux system membrane fusion protein